MELDTLTLAPENANKKLTPIEQAAQQLVDTVTRIITTQHADNTRTAHEANIRADNADREYTRLCHDYETLLAEHTALKQQIAPRKVDRKGLQIKLLQAGCELGQSYFGIPGIEVEKVVKG